MHVHACSVLYLKCHAMRAYMLLMCFVVSLSPQMDMSVLAELWRLTDLTEPRFCVAVIAIIFNPFFWNEVARWEHRTRGLTRLFGGPYVACYSLAVLILLLSVYRSHSITVAMKGAALVALGSVFVISSFMALGVTCTFLKKNNPKYLYCYCAVVYNSTTTTKIIITIIIFI
uniref:Phosphatidylethanolamine N-methyltransferase n=1 Tax=Sinocyclocheilus grahami TaxID=75366 RepID=A0A672L0A3_SINGR